MQSADRALHESGIQLLSQRMELYQVNQLTDESYRERVAYTELKRIGYTEVERARQLRIDEPSNQNLL